MFDSAEILVHHLTSTISAYGNVPSEWFIGTINPTSSIVPGFKNVNYIELYYADLSVAITVIEFMTNQYGVRLDGWFHEPSSIILYIYK